MQESERRPTTDLEQVQTYEIKIPKLSAGGLQALAFEHFNNQLKGESQPTAEEIVATFKTNGASTPKEKASKERQQKDWVAARCVEYLRTRIAEMNNPLVLLASKTKSPEARERTVWKIYSAIAGTYPDLAKAASEARIHKARQIAEIYQNSAPAVATEPLPEAKKDADDDAAVAAVREQAVEDAEGDLNQIANTQFRVLQKIHGYLVPLCSKHGITIDSQQASALVMNMLIQSFFQRTHQKMPRTKLEAKECAPSLVRVASKLEGGSEA